ncbi:MAG: hypothetical protein IJH41_07440 [Eubacterium sp.]|nr:hypothetical protein [Eubacterium sp.]MBQ3412051.1 hypothetical protein [Oscillospiraceae bacterium]
MREKDLPIDLAKHKVYSKNAGKCVRKLLRRYYDSGVSEVLWEKIQLKYCEFLEDEPALAGSKITLLARENSVFRRMTQLQAMSAGWSI